jgi:ribonuclease E
MTRSLEPELERAQAEFERRLLESARSDAPPAGETERAWLRFAARAGALVPLAVAASAPPPCGRSARASALKWTLVGAIGGGGLVAVWLQAPLSERVPPGSVAVAPIAGPPVVGPAVAVAAPAVSAPAAAVAAVPAPGVVAGHAATPGPAPVATPTAAAVATPAAAALRPQRKPPLSAKPGAVSRRAHGDSLADGGLAREVAALDAARSALALGANASALRQIERYHRDFPAGELSADADVVAIEALVADGDRAAARRAAAQFLERHPHDPHGARVRELAR